MKNLSLIMAFMACIFTLPAIAQDYDVIECIFSPLAGGSAGADALLTPVKGTNGYTFSYAKGSTATFSCSPNAGYKFVGWSASNVIFSTANIVRFKSNAYKTITAVFTPIPTYTVNITVNPAGGGTVTGAGQYKENTGLNVKAIPSPGWTFSGWTGFPGANGPVMELTAGFFIQASATLTATFTKTAGVILVLNAVPANGGTMTGAGDHPKNSLVDISATANPRFTFMNWTNSKGIIIARVPTWQVSSDEGPLYANFGVNLAVLASPGGGALGSGVYPMGTMVQVAASAQPGYVFVNWTDSYSNAVLSTLPVFKVLSDMTSIKANFKKL